MLILIPGKHLKFKSESEAIRNCLFDFDWLNLGPLFKIPYSIEYEIFGERSHILTNQRRECTVFSLLIG